MNNRRDFAEDVDKLSTAVETDVSRVMTLLRNDHAITNSTSQTQPAPQRPLTSGAATDSQPTAEPSTARRRPPPAKSRTKAAVADKVILENVTTRLHRETNDLLTEAALRQKLAKQIPATRQDIVEAALRDWFGRHGYLSTFTTIENPDQHKQGPNNRLQ